MKVKELMNNEWEDLLIEKDEWWDEEAVANVDMNSVVGNDIMKLYWKCEDFIDSLDNSYSDSDVKMVKDIRIHALNSMRVFLYG